MRNYFNFTKGERNAFFVLSAIALIIAILPAIAFRQQTPQPTDFSTLQQLAALDSMHNEAEQKDDSKYAYNKQAASGETSLFLFNPNTADKATLIKLGFRPFLAERIIKYRNAGGAFKVKSDITKIYGIDESFVTRLFPYIDLPEQIATNNSQPYNGNKQENYTPKKYAPVNLNTADTATLNRLKGIGHKLSQRIVNYREKLGGFYSTSQLAEVYGLSPETIADITPKLATELQPYKMIAINTATAEELGQHPYIKYKLAAVIVNYRTQHGHFSTADDLLKVKLIDELTLSKLKNYLKF